MKVILLLSAAYANGGAFVDAGESLPIGDGKGEITSDRAKDMEKSKLGTISEVADDAADDGKTPSRGGRQ